MASSSPENIRVRVFYAEAPDAAGAAGVPGHPGGVAEPRSWTVALELPAGARVGDAIAASGLMEHLPGLAMADLDLGVFNRPCTAQRLLEQGDRVEIYRPLQIDPKAARHLRVQSRRKDEARARQRARAAAGSNPAPPRRARPAD